MTLEISARPRVPGRLGRGATLKTKLPARLGPSGSAVRAGSLARARRAVLDAFAAGDGVPRPVLPPRRDPVLALVQRITQGFRLDEYERALALGYEDYLEEQLEPLAIDDAAMDARLAGFTTLAMSPKQLIDGFTEDIARPFFELKGAMLLRSVFSKRQLFERMCEFWSDHFSIDHRKGDVEWALKPEDDLRVTRAHALGSFPALLSASAHSGAMLYYLDNWLNFAGAPQENYARELMELHTLGVGGGYTENDVREVAKCFTGWTLDVDLESPDFLRSQFVNAFHERGTKTVLGVTIPQYPGRENAQRVLDVLAVHPSTARFLAKKLIRWFLTETPPASLVDQVAAVYLATGGDIKALLRAILARENVAGASAPLAPRFRRPFHLMTSILRGLDARVEDPLYLIFYLYFMGHSPFDWPAPSGYPDSVRTWGSSLLPRWTFLSHLLEGAIPGVTLPIGWILGALAVNGPDDHAGLARRIDRQLLGGSLTAFDELGVQRFVDSLAGPLSWPEVMESIALAASSPGFQWY